MELQKVINVKRDAEELVKKADILINKCRAHNERQTGQEPLAFKDFRQAAEKVKNNIGRNVKRPQPKNLHMPGSY